MNRFSIVEFEDGLQLVPTKWLKGSSECFWPKHGNIKRLHKNISECEDPDDVNWDIAKVVRIFGTAKFQKELLRKLNRIDAKLDRINDKLHSIEEKLDGGINHKNTEYFDIAEIALFPLKTKEDLEKLERDLQNADVFKNMVRYSRYCITRFI
ncbi:hypothetical protein ALC57_18816 [Trachymyrmex cornetzi]|uniref:Uncharacterized protein n=1 Tax=Trachymyrmex cornetzi TaxID=471704 RepID=A0A151IQY0_9HYME|nr:hypothetical protein ALC57_18816 [Trachymyrmex cornetzi]